MLQWIRIVVRRGFFQVRMICGTHIHILFDATSVYSRRRHKESNRMEYFVCAALCESTCLWLLLLSCVSTYRESRYGKRVNFCHNNCCCYYFRRLELSMASRVDKKFAHHEQSTWLRLHQHRNMHTSFSVTAFIPHRILLFIWIVVYRNKVVDSWSRNKYVTRIILSHIWQRNRAWTRIGWQEPNWLEFPVHGRTTTIFSNKIP